MLQKTHSSTLTDQERTCSFWSSLLAISQRQREQRFWLPMPSFVLHTTANSRALPYAYICRNACPTLSNVIYEKFLETPVAQTPTETLLDLTVDDGDHQWSGPSLWASRLQQASPSPLFIFASQAGLVMVYTSVNLHCCFQQFLITSCCLCLCRELSSGRWGRHNKMVKIAWFMSQ